MKGETRFQIVPLTVEELVLTIRDAAWEATDDEEKGQEIARFVLMKLLAASASETAAYLPPGCASTSIH